MFNGGRKHIAKGLLTNSGDQITKEKSKCFKFNFKDIADKMIKILSYCYLINQDVLIFNFKSTFKNIISKVHLFI